MESKEKKDRQEAIKTEATTHNILEKSFGSDRLKSGEPVTPPAETAKNPTVSSDRVLSKNRLSGNDVQGRRQHDTEVIVAHADKANAKDFQAEHPIKAGELVQKRPYSEFTLREKRICDEMSLALASDPQMVTNTVNRSINRFDNRIRRTSAEGTGNEPSLDHETQHKARESLVREKELVYVKKYSEKDGRPEKMGDNLAQHCRDRGENMVNSAVPGSLREISLSPHAENKEIIGQIHAWNPGNQRWTPYRSEYFIPAKEMRKLVDDKVISPSGKVLNTEDLIRRFAIPFDNDRMKAIKKDETKNDLLKISMFQVVESTKAVESICSPRWVDDSKTMISPGGGKQIVVYKRLSLQELHQA